MYTVGLASWSVESFRDPVDVHGNVCVHSWQMLPANGQCLHKSMFGHLMSFCHLAHPIPQLTRPITWRQKYSNTIRERSCTNCCTCLVLNLCELLPLKILDSELLSNPPGTFRWLEVQEGCRCRPDNWNCFFNENHIFLFSSSPSSFLSPLLYIYSLVSKCWLHIIAILSFPWSPDSCPCLRARSRRTRSSRGRSSPSWKRSMSSSSSPPLPPLSPSRVVAL